MGHYGSYAPEDFQKLLQLLATLKGKFMLSSYPSELLSSFVQRAGWRIIEFDLPCPAGGERNTEVLTMNYYSKDAQEEAQAALKERNAESKKRRALSIARRF
ncbi:MAG: hypothetical protein LBC81_01900 [Tannerellaceae bacterium]|jgi:predicted DsbA family dithiol-disulfide isomerase|nr:hypothetical protein [Tannerellaceae bacterium]